MIGLQALALSVAIAASPYSTVVDRVDVTEVNHYYEQRLVDWEDNRYEEELVFSQLIWWEWIGYPECRYHVVDWRMLDRCSQPTYNYRRKLWVTQWLDHKHKKIVDRKVVSPLFRETKTYYDIEIAERMILPVKYRGKLTELTDGYSHNVRP